MEQTDKAYALAERSLERAERLNDREMRGPALAPLSQTHGQREQEGDLGLAVELGNQALEVWVPGSRAIDLAEHGRLHTLSHYWGGGYAKAVELGRWAREPGGDIHSAGALLDPIQGLALTALGRHEEAIELFDSTIARARELDSTSSTAYALNCSTSALRDLLDLPEARMITIRTPLTSIGQLAGPSSDLALPPADDRLRGAADGRRQVQARDHPQTLRRSRGLSGSHRGSRSTGLCGDPRNEAQGETRAAEL